MVRECRPPARRGAPIILTVDAAAMHAAGHAFYQAAMGDLAAYPVVVNTSTRSLAVSAI